LAARHGQRFSAESLERRLCLAAVPKLGMNLDQVVDYNPAWTLTDAY
jgi:hypothetical protein